jgi:hypothetical protein
VKGRVVVSDEAGDRLVELNEGVNQVTRLVLLPRQRYFATHGDEELDGFGVAEGDSVSFDSLSVSTRRAPRGRGGRMDEAFRTGLFVNPFTRETCGRCGPGAPRLGAGLSHRRCLAGRGARDDLRHLLTLTIERRCGSGRAPAQRIHGGLQTSPAGSKAHFSASIWA